MASGTPERRTAVGWKAAAWLVAVAVGSFVYMPICDLHFDCGCGWPGLGVGHAHCDVLQSGPPDCPWCYHSWLGYAVMAFASLLSAVATALARGPWRFGALAIVAIVAMLAGLLVAGLGTSFALDLPILAGR